MSSASFNDGYLLDNQQIEAGTRPVNQRSRGEL